MGYAFTEKILGKPDIKLKSSVFTTIVIDGVPKVQDSSEEQKKKYNFCEFEYNSRRGALTYLKKKDVYYK